MKLRSLEAFCAAVEERAISGAARRMYISQPSVSDRLAELEREAQVQLLKRSPQGVEPTEHGKLLYKHARKALDEVRGVDHLLHKLRSKRDMELHCTASHQQVSKIVAAVSLSAISKGSDLSNAQESLRGLRKVNPSATG